MRKIAIFVEGQTEQVFVEELLKNIFGKTKLNIETLQFSGKEGIRQIRIIRSVSITSSTKYLLRIYDCHGGGENSTVKSDIIEQFPHLIRESFSYIIGIRDVYPLLDIVKLKSMINISLPCNPILPVKIIFAVREIEAWFLSEETHYPKISSRISYETANEIAGYENPGIDVSKDDTEIIFHPSDILKQIYMKGGTTYDKSKKKVQRTVSVLNYENLYMNVRNRNNSLNELLTCLDGLIP
jgi:hypothetical protein